MTDHLSNWRLVMFPGLGADARLFAPQQASLPNLTVPPWIAPLRHETLETYAMRLAEVMPPERPLILGGQSFGGMIAYEMARHLRPAAVLLVGTCHERRGLRPIFRALRPIAQRLPPAAISMVKPIARASLTILDGLTHDQKDTLAAMFRDTDATFLTWAIGAILNWHPTPLAGIPVYHIHGRRDRLIPASGVDANAWIDAAGHLLNFTHAEEVNRFLAASMASALAVSNQP